LWELLTLIQTGKITKKMVVLLYGRPYWNEIINFNAMVRWGTISPADLQIFQYADSPVEAFEIVRTGLERFYVHHNRQERPAKKPDVRL
jgi:predicted Rossmann-fold nucleotide-binding protein